MCCIHTSCYLTYLCIFKVKFHACCQEICNVNVRTSGICNTFGLLFLVLRSGCWRVILLGLAGFWALVALHRSAEVKAISQTMPVSHETPREVKQVSAKTSKSQSGRSDTTIFVTIV